MVHSELLEHLLKDFVIAANDSNTTQPSGTFAATDAVTAADLLSLRKAMGKYGVNPSEVVYIVSQDVYYDLLNDAEVPKM